MSDSDQHADFDIRLRDVPVSPRLVVRLNEIAMLSDRELDVRLRSEADAASALVKGDIASVAAPVAMPARNWRRFMDDTFMAFPFYIHSDNRTAYYCF